MRYIVLILAQTIALGLVDCSHERHVIYHASSPDGSAEVQLVTFTRLPSLPANVAELELSTDRGKRIVKTWEASDMDPCFVCAGWTRDSGTVTVLFRDCSHATDLVAFDVRSCKTTDVTETQSALADQIRSQYSLPKSLSDPIAWASQSEQARRLFSETRYPKRSPQ